MKWNDFLKAECGAEANTKEPAPAAPPPKATTSAKPAPAPVVIGFPSAFSPKYSNESAARRACIPASIHIGPIKQTAEMADLKWIEKGGGYYGQCNKRLKGEAWRPQRMVVSSPQLHDLARGNAFGNKKGCGSLQAGNFISLTWTLRNS